MGLFSKWVESLDYEYEILSTCTRHISPRSTCEKCVQCCEAEAISIEKGKPVIDQKKCVECGICISDCPVQAIAGIYPKRSVIQNQLVVQEQGLPTPKELLILYKKGIKTIISEDSSLIDQWETPIKEANRILAQLNEEPFSISVKSVKEEEYFSRRELFNLWKNQSKSVVAQVAPAKWRFNQSDFHLPKYYSNYQFAQITIDLEKCSLCNACQRLCERNCFEIDEEKFTISSQGCSACKLCADACPERAITVEEHISEAEVMVHPIYASVCQSCQQPFHSVRENDESCVACTKRKSFFNN